jgi:hypothetical protein
MELELCNSHPGRRLATPTSEIAIGGKLGIDATKKMARSFKRHWPPLIIRLIKEAMNAKADRFSGVKTCHGRRLATSHLMTGRTDERRTTSRKPACRNAEAIPVQAKTSGIGFFLGSTG